MGKLANRFTGVSDVRRLRLQTQLISHTPRVSESTHPPATEAREWIEGDDPGRVFLGNDSGLKISQKRSGR